MKANFCPYIFRDFYGAPFGKKLCFVTHVFLAYLDHYLSDIYIGNIRLIYWTNCTLNRNKIHTQNKSDKIGFAQTARRTPFKENDFVTLVFSTYLDHYLSDIYIGNIRLKYQTNCFLSRTIKHAQNKSEISDFYVGQIVH